MQSSQDLTDVDKFNSLRSLLEGTAYDAIAGLTLSPANYADAVSILKRFGDQELIVSRHMGTLLNLEAVTSDKNLWGLSRLHDDVEAHVRGLKALGIEPDSYGAMLAPVLLNKLPPDIRLIVSREIAGKVDQILEHVEVELTARERAAHNMTPPPCQHDRAKPTATTLLAGGSRSNTILPAEPFIMRLHHGYRCRCPIADPSKQWTMLKLSCQGTPQPRLPFSRPMLQM